MNAGELRLDELVRFGDSLLDLHGRRLILHDAAALDNSVVIWSRWSVGTTRGES